MDEIEFFEYKANNEATLDRCLGNFIVDHTLRLINIGKESARNTIVENTDITYHDLNNIKHSHDKNYEVHEKILECKAFNAYDGTIYSSELSDNRHNNDFEQIVLFMERVYLRMEFLDVRGIAIGLNTPPPQVIDLTDDDVIDLTMDG